MKLKRFFVNCLYLYILFFLHYFSISQEIGTDVNRSQILADEISEIGRRAEYFMGGGAKDQLMIKVNIWGQVGRPGQFTIPINTDLVTFLSMAGGPLEKAKLDNIRIIRNAENQSQVIHVNIKKYLKTANVNLIPNLMPGDTIVVPGSAFHLLARTAQVLTQILTIYTFLTVIGIQAN